MQTDVFAELAKNEDARLKPYAGSTIRSKGRKYPEDEDGLRLPYQRDAGRIVHSATFRRLKHKTQVFTSPSGDHYRDRLTHTLEISQIARSICRVLLLNEDLVEAIVLAHDLGHTPFGHAGEEAMDEMMAGHGGFDHNAHSLRIVDCVEKLYPGFPGLNLTYEVREGIAKHNTPFEGSEGLGEFSGKGWPLLEAQIADMSDEIAYCSHDVDDGLRSGILGFHSLSDIALWNEARERVLKQYGEIEGKVLRSRMVSALLSLMVRDLVENTGGRLREFGILSQEDVRETPFRIVAFSERMGRMRLELKRFLYANVYESPNIRGVRQKAKDTVRELFLAYYRNPKELPMPYRVRIPQDGIHRVVCDYVSGMTDRFAVTEHARLSGG